MAAPNSQSPSVRTHFKTPEGRYKLSHEKTHPTSLLHYSHGKTITQVTLAHLKDKPLQTPSTSSSSSSTGGVGARFSAARLLGTGNGSRGLVFGGGNGFSGRLTGGAKSTTVSTGGAGVSNGPLASSYDGEGTFLIFNVGDAIFVSDCNSQDKDPIKCLHFGNANPICHTYDPDAKDGHDLLIGLTSGDVYTASLRQQLQDPGKKLIGAMHYNKDGAINSSRCTSVAWVPHSDGLFVVSHADGNLYIYDKNKDGSGDVPFPPVKDLAQFSVAHARSSKSNPIARWHICQGSINEIAFSPNGMYLAAVGRDGYLRVFEYAKEQLTCGSKSYFGALLCCAWSPDGKYVLTGGEDDLVQVWSMEDQRVVAWGEGHNSWVSAVAFDPYWVAPPSGESGESVTYRFGSVGQDTQLLLWDLAMDEVVVPLRRLGGTLSGSPAFREPGAQSARWESVQPVGILHPAPVRKEVPKLAPIMAHRVHAEPLSSLIFTKESILTACHEGHVKIWDRPGVQGCSPARNSDSADVSSKEKLQPAKSGLSQFKQ
ncbi:hypothetical protein R1flu_020274 [Riccia fluitans]|uniref:Dystrophia myotonica WD repeat-containing protein n=1 Tax=Riccia fluitans TaxID=41844 RepID=A0ABD1ZN71_9MARC